MEIDVIAYILLHDMHLNVSTIEDLFYKQGINCYHYKRHYVIAWYAMPRQSNMNVDIFVCSHTWCYVIYCHGPIRDRR